MAFQIDRQPSGILSEIGMQRAAMQGIPFVQGQTVMVRVDQ